MKLLSWNRRKLNPNEEQPFWEISSKRHKKNILVLVTEIFSDYIRSVMQNVVLKKERQSKPAKMDFVRFKQLI